MTPLLKQQLLQVLKTRYTDLIPYPYNKAVLLQQYIEAIVEVLYRGGDDFDWFDLMDLENATGELLDLHGDKLRLTRNHKGALLDNVVYKQLIKLKYAIYYGGFSMYNIAKVLTEFFGDNITIQDNNNGSITYFAKAGYENLLQVAIDKNCLPRPAGVKVLLIVIDNNKPFFGLLRAGQTSVPDGIIGFPIAGQTPNGEFIKSNQIIKPLFE